LTTALPEETLNRRLRLVDWRFLVAGTEAPRRVACGADDVEAALRTVATEVSDLASTPAGSADLAVGGGRSGLAALRRTVAPGGTCVVRSRGPAGPGRLAITRRLAHAGIAETDVYWAWPPPGSGLPRFWLPLASPAAAEHLLANRPALEGAHARTTRAVRDAVWRVARTGLLAPLWVFGRVPGTPADAGSSAAGLTALVDGGEQGAGALKWLLLTQGGRSINKVVALPFAGSDPRPLALVKVARVPQSDRTLEREAETLRVLQQVTAGVSGAPLVGSVGRVAGRFAVAESFLGGSPLWTSLRPATLGTLAATAADWSSRLVLPGAARPRSEWWARLVDDPVATFRERFGTVADSAELRATEARLSQLPDLPAAIEQRDFSPWNLALGPGGELVVHDWESAELRGLPVIDLVYFLTYAAFFLERSLESDRLEEAYTWVWDRRTDVGRPAAQALDLYLERAGVDRAAVPSLRLLTWIVHAAGEYERLCADTGGAPTGDALRKAVFFRLWRAELSLDAND
jgi:hypothetical protein